MHTALLHKNLAVSSREGNIISSILMCISYSFVRKSFHCLATSVCYPKMQWQRLMNNIRPGFWAPFFSKESVPGFLFQPHSHDFFTESFSSPGLSPARVPKAWRRTFSGIRTGHRTSINPSSLELSSENIYITKKTR